MRDVLADLAERFPGLGRQVLEDGEGIAPFVNVYLNSEDVRTLDGLDTEVRPGSTVILLPAMAGGERTLTPSLLETIGDTPLVELPRLAPHDGRPALRQARGPEPDGLDQGSRRQGDDRGRRGLRRARARPRAARADERQHGHLARLRGPAQGLSAHLRPPRTPLPSASGSSSSTARASCTPRPRRAPTAPSGSLCRWRSGIRAGSCPSSTATRPTPAPTTRVRAPRLQTPSRRSTPSSPVSGPAAPSWAQGTGSESFPELIVAAAEPLQGDLVYGLRSLADGYVPPILDVASSTGRCS